MFAELSRLVSDSEGLKETETFVYAECKGLAEGTLNEPGWDQLLF